MGYEILSNELFTDEGQGPPKKGRPERRYSFSEPLDSSSGVKPTKPSYLTLLMYIIAIIAILVLVYALVIITNSSTLDSKKQLAFDGQIPAFEKEYRGNLTLNTAQFTLNTSQYHISENENNVNLEQFVGKISMTNSSLIIKGKAKNIAYGNSQLKLDFSDFVLTTTSKASTTLYFNATTFNLKNGKLLLNHELTYHFTDAEIKLEAATLNIEFNPSQFYFEGKAKKVELTSPSSGLAFTYNEPVPSK